MYRRGQYAAAELLFKQALKIVENDVGPEHPNVAVCFNNLAEVYHTQGEYAKAELLLGRALAILEKTRGPEHPDVAMSLATLADFVYRTRLWGGWQEHSKKRLNSLRRLSVYC